MPEEVKVSELNVDEVLKLVGDDKELAASALEAEQASENPRSTLVEGLEKVLAAGDSDAGDEADAEAGESGDDAEAGSDVESESDDEPEDDEGAPASAFTPSRQDLAQAAMVDSQVALKESKDAQLRRKLGKE